jgi:hypothetical protein
VRADDATTAAITALIDETYSAIAAGADTYSFFSHPEMSVAGSELGELHYGPGDVSMLVRGAQMQGLSFVRDAVTIWQEGDVAWAQILGKVITKVGDSSVSSDYWTTAVFVRDGSGWHWRYWGGSEPTTH